MTNTAFVFDDLNLLIDGSYKITTSIKGSQNLALTNLVNLCNDNTLKEFAITKGATNLDNEITASLLSKGDGIYLYAIDNCIKFKIISKI